MSKAIDESPSRAIDARDTRWTGAVRHQEEPEMIALVQLPLAAVSLSLGPAERAHCVSVDAVDVQSRVESVLALADRSQMADQVSDLEADWKRNCPSSRRNASPATVTSLGRLLQVPELRWMTITVMRDVGPNLRYAEGALRLALADEEAGEREGRRAVGPGLLINYGVMPRSLRCLINRIHTGRENRYFCRYLQLPQ
jgi:hypothetical protein